MSTTIVKDLHDTMLVLSENLNDEITKHVIKGDFDDGVENTPADMSARYWLMQFLEPLSRKELKSVVDGFMVQLLNDEQAKKLVKFLLARFPSYYKEEIGENEEAPGSDEINFLNEQ